MFTFSNGALFSSACVVTQHDADWLKKALAASKDAASGSEKQAVAKAAAELFTKWDDAVRKEFVTKRNKLESSQLHTIKVSGKKDRPEHIAKLMEQEVERVAPEYNMEQLQRVVVDAYTKHSELHQYLREWVKSSEGIPIGETTPVTRETKVWRHGVGKRTVRTPSRGQAYQW